VKNKKGVVGELLTESVPKVEELARGRRAKLRTLPGCSRIIKGEPWVKEGSNVLGKRARP